MKKTILSIILFSFELFAQGVTVSWDAVTTLEDGNPANDPITYRVFYGTESRAYSDSLAASGTSRDISLVPYNKYFFAVKAYNHVGGSEFSEEVSKYVFITTRPEKAMVSLVGVEKSLAVGNLSRYSFFELHAGDPYYSNRTYVLKDLPGFMDSALAIKTRNGDEDKVSVDSNWIEFDVSLDVDVFVFYDQRLTPPAWVGEDTGLTAFSTDTQLDFFKIYRNSFEAGRVSLGGNEDTSGFGSMYFVAILPQ